jgi:TrmH family RNA methyltransferase
MPEPERISSRDNRRLGNARAVRDGRAKAQIFIEGRRLAEEAIRSGMEIDECFLVEGFADLELGTRTAALGARVFELPVKLFSSIADTERSQGIILIANRPTTSRKCIESRTRASLLPIVVMLKEINNPSNLGAILRTAEAAGVAGVVISKNSADVFSAKALRSAMGASFRLPVWDEANIDDAFRWGQENGLAVTAADISGATNYLDADWTVPRLLVFGSEAHGLSPADLACVDDRVTIPLDNDVESLNIAVSAGILLFEARRQNNRQQARS